MILMAILPYSGFGTQCRAEDKIIVEEFCTSGHAGRDTVRASIDGLSPTAAAHQL